MKQVQEFIRFTVRNLGLMIFYSLIITVLARGFSPLSQTMGLLIIVSVCVPMIFIYVAVVYDPNPNRLLARLVRNDVLLSLIILFVYVGGVSGIMDL